jgi:hypothetical protein
MKRFKSAGGAIVLAVVALVIGLVMKHEANFAHDNVRLQMAQQGIVFQPVDQLMPNQKTIPCLVANAGKPLLTGAQAACYADQQIQLDLASIFGTKTYAELSAPARFAARDAAVMAATDPNNPKLPELQAAAAKAEAPAQVAFQAQALRGMLLTTYAFDHMGDLGDTTATVLFIAAAVLLLIGLALGGLALRKPAAPAAAAPAA